MYFMVSMLALLLVLSFRCVCLIVLFLCGLSPCLCCVVFSDIIIHALLLIFFVYYNNSVTYIVGFDSSIVLVYLSCTHVLSFVIAFFVYVSQAICLVYACAYAAAESKSRWWILRFIWKPIRWKTLHIG